MGCSYIGKVLLYCLVVFVSIGCIGVRATDNKLYASEVTNASKPLGFEVIALRLTAAGSMLDFRYKVLDPVKAMPFFREDIRPYLIEEKNGITLNVTDTTKVGPMRPTSRNPRAGKVYFMFFHNPHKTIKPGDKVTIVVGEQRIENLLVQ